MGQDPKGLSVAVLAALGLLSADTGCTATACLSMAPAETDTDDTGETGDSVGPCLSIEPDTDTDSNAAVQSTTEKLRESAALPKDIREKL